MTETLTEPETRLVLDDAGLELVWDGEQVLAVITAAVATDPDGRPALDFSTARRMTLAGWEVTNHGIALAAANQAFRAYPGRYGAVPDRSAATAHDLAARSWFAPSMRTQTSMVFGQPMLVFQRPSQDCHDGAWAVQLVGLHGWITRIDWRDEAGVEAAVAMLDDHEYWQVVAAMEQPQAWAAAMANEARRAAEAAENERRRAAYAAATRDFVDHAVNTRAVARALRRIEIAEMPGVNRWREVAVRHIDLSAGGSKIRAGEQIVIQWNSETKAQRLAVRDAVIAALDPVGATALLTKGGMILVAADGGLLRRHLEVLSRAVCTDERKALTV